MLGKTEVPVVSCGRSHSIEFFFGTTLGPKVSLACLVLTLLILQIPARATVATSRSEVVLEESASQVLTGLRPSVVKIVNVSTASGSETASGTGFVAGGGNLVVTNYHVVSDIALRPRQFRLEYLGNDGSRGSLQIVAMDVANDLALVRLDKPLVGATPIPIAQRKPDKGETVLSVGYPLEKGLTIVSGAYNGRAEDYFQELIHYSGAVNSGMSGGPAVDLRGNLVGVNVAVTRNAQLVSLLVPANKVQELLSRTPVKDTTAPDYWRLEVGRQLHQHSDVILDALAKRKMPTRKFDSYTSVDIEPLGFKCNGIQENASGKYQREMNGRVCRTGSGVYVDGNTYLGYADFYTGIRTNKGINAFRFAEVRRLSLDYIRIKTIEDDPDKNKTGYECTEGIVKVNNFRAKTVACLRRDYRFEDLYDMTFILHSIESDVQSMQLRVEMRGMPYAGTQSIIKRAIEGVSWSR
jgi:hypothetical protein